MSQITTHVLDTSIGRPAAGIPVRLERKTHSAGWQVLAEAFTDVDGRVKDLLRSGDPFLPGHYRLTFETGAYFLLRNIEGLFPQITISFSVKDAQQHYHIPVLLSPYGYTTCRGS